MSIKNIEQQVVQEGYDRRSCWVHARAAALPDGQAVITTQRLLLNGSDVFYGIHSLHSKDAGRSWSAPQEHSELGRRQVGESEVCPCDGTPQWHAASGRLLLTGHIAVYRGNILARPYQHHSFYSVYDADTGRWRPWQTLPLPNNAPLRSCGAGCSQRVDLPNGEILLPVYGNDHPENGCLQSLVLRCAFDGQRLRYLASGTPLSLPIPRGYAEPSLTEFAGRYYLTLRNDLRGYVTVGDDGLNFATPKPWCWDDGEEIGNYNTQQHWLKGAGRLYLVYTRRGAQNEHVFRHRAPLFIAQVDSERLCLLRDSERIVVPEKGARLGNFGVTQVNDHEAWVLAAEWMQTKPPNPSDCRVCERYGANNRLWLSRISF
jgi:hypothetical protein